MARRRGRLGTYLLTDDYSGVSVFANKTRKDYWGNISAGKILLRNLQEVATPLNDPYPIKVYRGPSYEFTNSCIFETQPQFIGNTSIPFPTNAAINSVINFTPGIGEATVGCTLIVTGAAPSPKTWDSGSFWDTPGATWD